MFILGAYRRSRRNNLKTGSHLAYFSQYFRYTWLWDDTPFAKSEILQTEIVATDVGNTREVFILVPHRRSRRNNLKTERTPAVVVVEVEAVRAYSK